MRSDAVALKQSQYLQIRCGDDAWYTLTAGRVEVYACTPEDAPDYHKMFLMELRPGEAFYPPVEMHAPMEFSIFATLDSELSRSESSGIGPEIFKDNASAWFKKLTELPCIRYLVGMDDDVVSRWDDMSVFADVGAGSAEDVKEAFLYNQEVLSMLITAQFRAVEAHSNERASKRTRQSEKTMFAAMSSLLRTEYRELEGAASSSADLDDPVRYAVKAAVRRLGMETENISIPQDIASKLDSLSVLRRLARKANMQIRLVSLPKDWYKSDAGVILGFYGEEREPVALIPSGVRKYRMESASRPNGVPVDRHVASKIQGDAFVCYAGLPPRKLNLRDMARFVMRSCWKKDWHTVWMISLLSGILALALPLITETIFKDIIPINDRRALGAVTQVMLVSGFTTAILGMVRGVSFLRIKGTASSVLEPALWSRLIALPTRFFRQYDVGDLVNRMYGVSQISALLEGNVLSTLFDTVFSFWSLILMLHYSAKLTMIAMIPWLVYLLFAGFIYKSLVLSQGRKIEAGNKTSARTLQILSGLSKFKLQGSEDAAFHLWAKEFGDEWGWNLKTRWRQSFITIINSVQPIILTMAVYYFAMGSVGSADEGSGKTLLTAAAFMGFQAAFSGFNSTLVSLVPLVASIFNVAPYIRNIKPILEAEPEVTDDKLDASALSGEIDINNLYFSYAPDSPIVLKGISLHVKAGESVAFVGGSGCGKSTLIRLILGFEKPTQGAVCFDGQDLSTLNVSSVRSQMGVVLQNGQLMSGDIFTNIVGSMPLTQDDAWEAARMVGLDIDIEKMPMGMNTMISEGAGNISGGQRQRILIARSIVNRPKIIIMDEATSALDNTTQAIVTSSVKSLKATRITVAHRLSTIKDADRIFVMKDGLIAEEGDYETLMARDGLFTKLAKRQLE
ncbi:MAG: NHLP bacteriocin export ABC transporter permease/ATPase subunit [Synergistaceae bacterium]|jgi:ATP-binding cassette subfamily C protein|nr:NHLP bacteriocin export ABC transporter permease/ATPase subunit [Synergistaceae bacterium]